MDQYWMQYARELAAIALAARESPVGAIILWKDQIMGRGIEGVKAAKDIRRHAEMEAITDAVKNLQTIDLSECELYSTHEPCVMCAYAIRYHKIKKLVFEHRSGKLGAIFSAYPLLRDSGLDWGPIPEIVEL